MERSGKIHGDDVHTTRMTTQLTVKGTPGWASTSDRRGAIASGKSGGRLALCVRRAIAASAVAAAVAVAVRAALVQTDLVRELREVVSVLRVSLESVPRDGLEGLLDVDSLLGGNLKSPCVNILSTLHNHNHSW